MKKEVYILLYTSLSIFSFSLPGSTQSIEKLKEVTVGTGWANNSVNTVVFRKNSLCSFGDTQYISYYNSEGLVVIGKRKHLSGKWELKTTSLKGNIADAHNSISIVVDGSGFLHLAWDHHNSGLRYCRSIQPGSMQMTAEMSMTGKQESRVTYPEFYSLPNGDLLFLYRDGSSGQGNLVVNRYDTKKQQWAQLYTNLIDGEKMRNAYWQACVDKKGTIHISWVWRETPDVASNHDMCYARSKDGGLTWENSKGEKYQLPVKAATAEYACLIPQGSELINQTSMTADDEGRPVIASYWKEKEDSVPQYHIVRLENDQWKVQNLGFRKTSFSLSGTGTKRIPISRPQVVAEGNKIALFFRDEERGSKVSVAVNDDLNLNKWKLSDLTATSVGSWEPSFDTELWRNKKQVDLFVQYTEQKDSEGKAAIEAQPIRVLSVKMK